jgi:hypothetical protein
MAGRSIAIIGKVTKNKVLHFIFSSMKASSACSKNL